MRTTETINGKGRTMMHELLECDRGTNDTIFAIIRRLRETYDVKFDALSLSMDLTVCSNLGHVNLAVLLKSADGNFAHDLGGIATHFDRETGELGDCFVPHCKR